MRNIKATFSLILIFIGIILISLIHFSCISGKVNHNEKKITDSERLRVSKVNPHLLETVKGTPVFLNNYTIWALLAKAKREEIGEFYDYCKKNNYNMISTMILTLGNDTYPESKMDKYTAGISPYGAFAFELDSGNLPNPLKPIVTPGNNHEIPGQYDFWDHLDFLIGLAADNGIYVSLHPAWGDWFSGGWGGEKPGDPIIFNEINAYKYGQWLGKRYGDKANIIWTLGGDRSAVYFPDDPKTYKFNYVDTYHDYRPVYSAMAEGLADGANGFDDQDGKADYSNILITFHPRKWAPNSSEWFHNHPWLSFNSIQDTPEDQVKSVPYDYNLQAIKPTWLYEGRYEGAITAWGIRFQAYQTVFSGAFGHTYGNTDYWYFPPDWREMFKLQGANQMKYLYVVSRGIWTDKQFLDRIPDQQLIIGDQGATSGDGITVGDGDGINKNNNAFSDRITAMRGSDGKWALVYTANGNSVNLDLSRLFPGKLDAFWFNPRNGKWWVSGTESEKMVPFLKGIKTGKGSYLFDAPGNPVQENDWVLVLKKKRIPSL